MHQLYMNEDEWLVAAPHRYAGERLDRRRRGEVPGQYKLIIHDKAMSPAMRTSVVVTLEPETAESPVRPAAGISTATATSRVELDGVTYRGVFTTQWDDDQGAWVHAFSALSPEGVAAWGSQTVVARPPRKVALRGACASLRRAVHASPCPGRTGTRGTRSATRWSSGPPGLGRRPRHRCRDVAAVGGRRRASRTR